MGIPATASLHLNVGPDAVANEVFDRESCREAIRELNQEDYSLYEFVSTKLEDRRDEMQRLGIADRTGAIAKRRNRKREQHSRLAQEYLRHAGPDLLREEGGLDAECTFERYPDLSAAKIDPYEHYWEHGWREGRDPNPHFSTSWYLKSNPDVAEKELNPLAHYLAIGRAEGVQPASSAILREEGGLDAEWYLRRYPDLSTGEIDPYEHYWKDGWREGRDPNPYFSTSWYLKSNPDVAEKELNPLAHYLAVGRAEGVQPASSAILREEGGLDAEWYLRRYPDLSTGEIDPYEHYWKDGWREGRDPNPHFSTSWYLKSNPDVAEKELNPLAHYLVIGKAEGRQPTRFAKLHSELLTSNVSPWRLFFDHNAFFPRNYHPEPQLTAPFGDATCQPIFFAGHTATRTGAPLVLLRLIEELSKLPGVEPFLFLGSGGPLLESYREFAHVFLNDDGQLHSSIHNVMQILVGALATKKPIIGVANSAESWRILREMREARLRPILALIHEDLSRYQGDIHASILESADHIVFPSEATRLAAVGVNSQFSSSDVMPQGLLNTEFGKGTRLVARRTVRERLGIPLAAKIVLACGSRDRRKGVDLFIDLARRVVMELPDTYFVWIGGFSDDDKSERPEWICEAVQEHGLCNRIHWVETVPDPEDFFQAADIFVLTSRNDPFPCVVHEAMACRLPILVFEGSGGAAEAISGGCGVAVGYLDTISMATWIKKILDDPEMGASLGVRAERKVRRVYRFDEYSNKIARLCTLGAPRQKTPADAPTIFFAKRDWSISGADTMSSRLVRELCQRGMDARLLFISLSAATQPFVPDVPRTVLGIGNKPWPEQWTLLERFLRSHAPCVLVTGYDYATSAISARLPDTIGVIGTLHGDDVEHYDHVARLGRYWNRIIAVSAEIARKTELYFGDAVAGKVRYVPNFATDFSSAPRAVRGEGAPIRLIYSGRIIEQPKRVSDLAEISRKLDRANVPFHLVLIGDGPDRKILEAEMASLIAKGSVTFLGRRTTGSSPSPTSERYRSAHVRGRGHAKFSHRGDGAAVRSACDGFAKRNSRACPERKEWIHLRDWRYRGVQHLHR